MSHLHCIVLEIQGRNSHCGWMTGQTRPTCAGERPGTPKDQMIAFGKDSKQNTQLYSHCSKWGGLLFNQHIRRKTIHRVPQRCPMRRLTKTSCPTDRLRGSTCVNKFTSRFMHLRACSQGATPTTCAQTRHILFTP